MKHLKFKIDENKEKQLELEGFTYIVEKGKKVIGVISGDEEEITFSFNPKYKEYLVL